jgi:hypothetical protein
MPCEKWQNTMNTLHTDKLNISFERFPLIYFFDVRIALTFFIVESF